MSQPPGPLPDLQPDPPIPEPEPPVPPQPPDPQPEPIPPNPQPPGPLPDPQPPGPLPDPQPPGPLPDPQPQPVPPPAPPQPPPVPPQPPDPPAPQPEAAIRLRQGARALVLDAADRVLLVHFRLRSGDLWATPGGGVEDGETLTDAVRRELHEEAGYADVVVGPAIWTRRHVLPFGGHDGQEETFFLVRVDHEPAAPLLTDDQLLAENVTGRAWWSLDELRRSDEKFAPRRLPELVATLVAHGPPDSPVDVGV